MNKADLKDYRLLVLRIEYYRERIQKLKNEVLFFTKRGLTPPEFGSLFPFYEEHLQVDEEKRQKILDAIDSLEPIERDVLTLRYLEGHTAEETAEALHYSFTHIERIHSRALKKLASIEV